jgi:hypothetical protein
MVRRDKKYISSSSSSDPYSTIRVNPKLGLIVGTTPKWLSLRDAIHTLCK